MGPRRTYSIMRDHQDETTSHAPAEDLKRRSSWLSLHVELLKPRIILLLEVTALCGVLVHDLLAADSTWSGTARTMLVVLLGGFLASGGANALNMWFDRDIDALMSRTRLRPLPRRQMAPHHVLYFGLATSVLGTALITLLANPVAGAVTGFSVFFYVVVYTMLLKRRTPQNIVIGGVSGATPPLIGWAAAGGSLLTPLPWLMFLLIFLWTPPHFWALALFVKDEYSNAGVPMLPNVKGEMHTRKQIAAYGVALILLAPMFLTVELGLLFLVLALVLNLQFLRLSWRVVQEPGPAAPRKLFLFSLLYLFALFGLMVMDAAVYNQGG